MKYSALQVRELFHLEFLRELVKKIPASSFVLKGGSNLRFFFGSIRYSEDMDLDVREISVEKLQSKCLEVLSSRPLLSKLRSFGIEEIVPPDMQHAKQTKTVQRFKLHLITSAGEDLFTKVEFSRRGFDSMYRAEAVAASVLNDYLFPPIIVQHYLIEAAIGQKIKALVERRQTEARDVFDLYLLGSHMPEDNKYCMKISSSKLKDVKNRIYSVDYGQFLDQVISYLALDDQSHYRSRPVWDEIRLNVIAFVERRFITRE